MTISTPDMNVLDVIKKEVGQEGSNILNMAVALRNLGLAIFQDGFGWIKNKINLATKILELEQEILQAQEFVSNLGSEVIEGKIESKSQVTRRYQDLNKMVKEVEADIESYGRLQVSNVGSMEIKRIFYFVRVIGN